jgi:hypothetical protein
MASPAPSNASSDDEWCLTLRRPMAIKVSDHGAAYRLAHHATLGAEMARRAGASEATVRYISGGAAEHERDKLSLLHAADDKS